VSADGLSWVAPVGSVVILPAMMALPELQWALLRAIFAVSVTWIRREAGRAITQ
jgi:hypothetical protein